MLYCVADKCAVSLSFRPSPHLLTPVFKTTKSGGGITWQDLANQYVTSRWLHPSFYTVYSNYNTTNNNNNNKHIMNSYYTIKILCAYV